MSNHHPGLDPTPPESPTSTDDWARLSPRKLLLDPVKTLASFLVPALIALLGISRSDGPTLKFFLPVLVVGPILFGMLPWLTTQWRMTPTQFQVRSGLLNKRLSTAPLDRIRSVDLEASLLHRLLGLQRVKIGTGVDGDRIDLDGMVQADAHRLRAQLLHKTPPPTLPATDAATAPEGVPAAPLPDQAVPTQAVPTEAGPLQAGPTHTLATMDWAWLRFAPFSLSRLVVVAAAIGVLSQFADDLPIWNTEFATNTWEWITGFAIPLLAITFFVGALIAWLIISIGGYIAQWWDYRLTRADGSLHQASGLITTKSVSLEERKIRGIELTEPVLLRVVGGAEVHALATGVGGEGLPQVTPPCPRDVAVGIAAEILQEYAPLQVELSSHGPAARRRAWWRQLRHALIWPVAAIAATLIWDLTWWLTAITAAIVLPLAFLVGELQYRHLGHALTGTHLVSGHGALARVRTILELDGIIGWVIDQNWFQRRVDLATLVATTAAGSERVIVRDVPLTQALQLADAATPEMLTPFLRA